MWINGWTDAWTNSVFVDVYAYKYSPLVNIQFLVLLPIAVLIDTH